MKTPPVQQKAAAAPQQETPSQESEGKSMTPPAFQLKTSEAPAAQLKANGQQGGGQNPVQRAAEIYTINNDQAYLRGGPPGFKSLGKNIPQWTDVEIVEEQSDDKDTYVRVKDYDSGKELGWTKKENVTGMVDYFKPAKSNHVYHIGGYDVLVFTPKDVAKTDNPNVFLFFHGNGGDYGTSMMHPNGKNVYEDNPALSANMPGAVANTGSIAICPQGHHQKMSTEWGGISPEQFKSLVDETLIQLSADLGRADKPLKAGNVSVAGHSAGGAALGKAAKGANATDVTLQDAGYGFTKSWTSLREWFFTPGAAKTMRVITKPNSTDTSTLTDAGGHFDKSQIIYYGSSIKTPVTVEEFKGDGKTVEEGGIILKRGFRVFRKGDGSLVGSVRIYERKSGDHWAASSGTMEASMTSGAKDKAADEDAIKNKKK